MPWYSKFYDSTGLIEIGGVHLPARSWFGNTPKEDLEKYAESMRKAEESGELNDLFRCACFDPVQRPTKDKLLNAIKPDMRLFRSLFVKIYGYELSYPGFAKTAIEKLEMAGCSKAEEYYNSVVNEHDKKQKEVITSAAEYLRRHEDERRSNWKSKEKRQEVEQLKEGLQKKNDRELLILLQRLKAENTL
mgnify:CR=1 FL=1